jgi:peroxiredoxin
MRLKRSIPLGFLSIGLFSLGIASFLLLSSQRQTNEQTSNEFSIECIEPAEVHFAAPAITLTDLGENEVEVGDYLGEIVLLNTWATWCPPCLAEMPDLQAFYEKYKHRGFSLIGVNIGESQAEVLNFAIENELTFPLWLDPDEQSLRALNTISLPYSVVIDRDGTVRYAWSGATCLDALEHIVAPLILQ